MSTKYKVHNNERPYFITLTVADWIDLFTRKNQKHNIVEAIEYCQKNKGMEVFAWCLMPSHLHMICASKGDFILSDTIRDFKKYTSRKILELIEEEPESRREWILDKFRSACSHLSRNQKNKVWQTGYHGIELFSPNFTQQKIDYIHNNPVVDELVATPEEYLYSSARDYAGEKGLIHITIIERQWTTL
jgi:REP element-mobilizing transposase RayT